MQGALYAVTRKGIPDRETDGASLCLAILQQINASERYFPELGASSQHTGECSRYVDPSVDSEAAPWETV
jgi:hypothetical protein